MEYRPGDPGYEAVAGNCLDYQIEDIMTHFDFEKVHKAMEAVNWKWGFPASKATIPTVKDLKERAREFLERLVKDGKDSYIMSGGFTAIRISLNLQLLFVLESQGYDLHIEGPKIK
jgi:hypothetical protein